MFPGTLVERTVRLSHIEDVLSVEHIHQRTESGNPGLPAGTGRHDSHEVFLCPVKFPLDGKHLYMVFYYGQVKRPQ